MKIYEKPIAEIVEFQPEDKIMGAVGPGGEFGTSQLPPDDDDN